MDKTKKSFKSAILALVFALILLPCAIFLVGCDEEKKQPTLTLLSSFKTVYAVDEELDVTGGKLLYTDENGKSGTVYITASLVTGFDSSVPGTREMIVTYKDLSVEVTYTVKEEPMSSIDKMEKNVVYAGIDQFDLYTYVKLTDDNTIEYYQNSEATMEGVEPIIFNVIEDTIKDGKHFLKTELAEIPEGNPERYVNTIEITVVDDKTINIDLLDVLDDELMSSTTLTKMA